MSIIQCNSDNIILKLNSFFGGNFETVGSTIVHSLDSIGLEVNVAQSKIKNETGDYSFGLSPNELESLILGMGYVLSISSEIQLKSIDLSSVPFVIIDSNKTSKNNKKVEEIHRSLQTVNKQIFQCMKYYFVTWQSFIPLYENGLMDIEHKNEFRQAVDLVNLKLELESKLIEVFKGRVNRYFTQNKAIFFSADPEGDMIFFLSYLLGRYINLFLFENLVTMSDGPWLNSNSPWEDHNQWITEDGTWRLWIGDQIHLIAQSRREVALYLMGVVTMRNLLIDRI